MPIGGFNAVRWQSICHALNMSDITRKSANDVTLTHCFFLPILRPAIQMALPSKYYNSFVNSKSANSTCYP